VWFSGSGAVRAGRGVQLDARTRMMYDERHVYINGEAFRAGGRDARLMQQLADDGQLPAAAARRLSADAAEQLDEWVADGWMQALEP
jgi:50S ribosomal protein L16 3-hydroxylase